VAVKKLLAISLSLAPKSDWGTRNSLRKQIFLIGLVMATMVMMVGCGKKKESPTVPSLLPSLKDRDPKMRYYATRQLGHFRSQATEVVPPLTEALKDEDKMVRMGAAYALGEIGPDAKSALSALESVLRDSEVEVRKAAEYAIKKVRNLSSQGQEEAQPRKHKRKFPKGQR
jgi:HEAT repeat protein